MAQYAAERSEAAATTANPAPLGLSAFALTTFVLSSANAGFFKGVPIVLGLALFYGGLVQLLAGLQEFRAGNTFGATAFCSYGGFWLAYGAILIPAFGIVTAYGGDTPAFHTAAGYFLLGWTIFTGMMFLSSLRTNLATMGVFGFLFLTFLSLAIGALGGGSTFDTLGGWLGIITALVAWYTALAGVLASHKSMFTLPTWPRS
ncbi:MAG: GPR1/FUN34/YaaH family transporter [Ktedonobacteraceae bacterium]